MAVKVIQGQIYTGTNQKYEYYLCGKFHTCIQKYTLSPFFGPMLLYYIYSCAIWIISLV